MSYVCKVQNHLLMNTRSKTRTQKLRLQSLHNYYVHTGFYDFIWQTLKKAMPLIISCILALFIVDHFFNINESLTRITEILPIYGVLAFFFASETILGLIPPEIFIAWSTKLSQPVVFVSILAVLSYCGGLASYFIGKQIVKIESIRNYLEVKMKKQLENSRKWGGILILVGALLPLPFSIACMASGIIKLPFKTVWLYGSLRLVRFAIYGFVVFSVM